MKYETNVKTKIAELTKVAEKAFGKPLMNVPIRYDIKGTSTLGQVVHRHTYSGEVLELYMRLHPVALELYGDTYIEETVVHEFAHAVQVQLYPHSKPHGSEWKSIMSLFGKGHQAKATTRTYDLKGAAAKEATVAVGGRTLKTFTYKCDCMEHELTSIRHNRILKGKGYKCNKCGQKLVKK